MLHFRMAICEGVVSRMRDRGCFHCLRSLAVPDSPDYCLRCFLKMSFSLHQASGYLTTERGWFPLSVAASLRMRGCGFQLPPENKREHFPLDRVAICVLTTLSGEATQVGLVLH